MRRFFRTVFLLALLAAIGAGAAGWWWVQHPLTLRLPPNATSLDLSIEPGTLPRGVAVAVRDAGVRVDPRVLYLWFRISGEGQRIKAGERILFKTPNSRKSWKTDSFDEDFVYISKEAAAFLAKAKVMTVGIDYLSVGGFRKDGIETHHALLGAGIWVIEGLNLAKIKPGRYELCCLPLKILNSDGAPARAVLRPI